MGKRFRARLAVGVALSFAWESATVSAATGFDLTLVRPAQTSDTFVGQNDARMELAGTRAFGVFQQLTLDPLVLRDPISGKDPGAVVGTRLETTLGGRWTPWPRLTLGASLAAVPWQSGKHGEVPLADASARPAASALGDLGLGFKVGLLGPLASDGFHVAAVGDLLLPTGSATAYAGAGGWRARLHAVTSYDGRSGALALNAGFDRLPRADVPLAGVLVDNQWTVGVAGAWKARPTLSLVAEAQLGVLFETAQRLYPRGVGAALAQVPAYALLGARQVIAPHYVAVLGVWRGLDQAPGAASLGVMAGLVGSWDRQSAPPDRVHEQGDVGDVGSEREGEVALPSHDGSAETPTPAESLAEENVHPEEPPEPTHAPSGRSTPAAPPRRSTPASSELATRIDDEIRLSEPLPWKGRSAKLAPASIPALRAIAALMKAEPSSSRLTVQIEAVGKKPADLALAKRRAAALRGVLAHLARWRPARLAAAGVAGTAEATNVHAPPLTLRLTSPGHTAMPAADDAPASPPVAKAERPPADAKMEPPPAREPAEDAPAPASPPPDGALCWKDGDEIRLASPLPWQGRTAKLSATSIPTLRELAAVMKREPASSHLALVVAPGGARPADKKVAKTRALALRGVLAHLARWSPKRITAGVGSGPPGAEEDVHAPSITFRLDGRTGGDGGGTKPLRKKRRRGADVTDR